MTRTNSEGQRELASRGALPPTDFPDLLAINSLLINRPVCTLICIRVCRPSVEVAAAARETHLLAGGVDFLHVRELNRELI